MIITRTPMRVSLVGGGTDMPAFYERHPGSVVSAAIDKYIYVTLNPKFDGKIRVSYSKTENVDDWNDIQHDIVREVLKLFQMKGVEIVSVSDIPGEGTGLGSSSAFTVGLLRAIYVMSKYRANPGSLAETAFMVESRLCNHPAGKQDHYAAAYGGVHQFIFNPKKVSANDLTLIDVKNYLNNNLMLFWTGITRKSDEILTKQKNSLDGNQKVYENGLLMAELANELTDEILNGRYERIGKFVSTGWKLKCGLAEGISCDWIEKWITSAKEAGAQGAKICGAGGGGFFLVVVDPICHEAVTNAVSLRKVPVKFGVKGSTVIYSEEG